VDINVTVCGEHTYTRAGVRALLESESDINVHEVSSTGRNAVSLIVRRSPHVVLACDLMPAMEIARGLGERSAYLNRPKPSVVALVAVEEEENIVDALRTGVRGIVRKDGEPAQLVQAVRAVAAGYASLTPSSARTLLDWVAAAAPPPDSPPAALDALTRTEVRVLYLLASGMTGVEIAGYLGVCDTTIRSHVHHLLTKLGLRSRSEAVAYAFRQGLVNGKPP
jgi:DNA-binding NarL/FixJ family response regulator